MEMKKVLTKGALLLSSVALLAACGEKKEETTTTVAETTAAATTVAETTVEDTTVEETTEAEATEEETTEAEATAELKDGEYKLESNEDERGWAHTFTIVVKDGKVTESKYDMVDKDGKFKSENAEYNKSMKDKSGASFAEAVEAYNKALVENQTAEVEVVSGATSTQESFVEYAKLLLEAAAKGETETIKVELKAN